MKNHVVVPLVLLATLSTLASCTKPVSESVVTPVKTPDVKVDVVTPEEKAWPTNSGQVTPTPTETATGTPVTATPTAITHKETVSYRSPGGKEEIEFDVTVTDGIITSAVANPLATNDGGKYNQGNFVKALSAAVVGKKAKDLSVDAIGGASLTTSAFEEFAHSF